jgi:hypothetical protein
MDTEAPSRRRRRDVAGGGILPVPPGYLLQEDGFKLTLEDASGSLLQEN